jgi:signal peptide peptidase SppA
MNALPHIAARLFNTPLLIHRAKLDAILAALGPRVGWPMLQGAALMPAPQTTPTTKQDGIAVIPIHGTLVRRALALEAASGLISYQAIDRQIQQAMADSRVAGIVLDIDSPGGEAGGVFELADSIRSAARNKPIWAVANDQAFSAAYALVAAADEVFITRTGGVGSIGVIALHADQSRRDDQEGLVFNAIYAGSHKNDFSPHTPLSDDARDLLQTEVNRLYGMFTESVAVHRDLQVDEVRATEARLYFGGDAVAAGLADRVGTLGDAIAAMRTQLSLTPTQEIPTMEHHDPEPIAAEEATAPVSAAQDAEAFNAALQAARAEERAEIQAIAELCAIAGRPQLASDFIARGMTQMDARQALLEMRAAGPEIASHLAPDVEHDTANTNPDHNPLMRIVRKQIGG